MKDKYGSDHIAFDWGGVLSDRPTMWWLADNLSFCGIKVSIISWCGPNDAVRSEEGKIRLADSGIPWANIIGFDQYGSEDGIIIPSGAPRYDYMVGIGKVRHMREIGATAIFDDNPWVVRAVQDSGLQAFQVIR